MLRNVKVGRIELNVNGTAIQVDVKEVKEAEGVALCEVNGKEKTISINALRTGKYIKEKKERAKSALSVAMDVLKNAMKPMKVSDIAAAVLDNGYEIPRGGKTFNITLSARLNSAAENGKIKKVVKGFFADNEVSDEAIAEVVKAENARSEKKSAKVARDAELAELAAEFSAEAL